MAKGKAYGGMKVNHEAKVDIKGVGKGTGSSTMSKGKAPKSTSTKAVAGALATVAKGAKKAVADAKKKSKAKKKKAAQKKTTPAMYNTRIKKMLEVDEASEKLDYIRDLLEDKQGIKFTRSGNISTAQKLTDEQIRVMNELIPDYKDANYEEHLKSIGDRMKWEKDRLNEAEVLAWQDMANRRATDALKALWQYLYDSNGPGKHIGWGTRKEVIAKAGANTLSSKAQINSKITEIAKGAHRGELSAYQIRYMTDEIKDLVKENTIKEETK